MKSKLFIILCTLTSFQQASCSMLPLFENEFGELFPSPTELTQMAAAEVASEVAQELKRLLDRSIIEVARDKVRDVAHGVWNSAFSHAISNACSVENFDIYGRRALDAALTAATIYAILKSLNGFGSGDTIKAITWKNISNTWGGPLPKEFEETLKAIKNYRVLQQAGVPSHNGYLFHGVPGTGKTFLVRVLSEKLQIPLIETNSGQFLGMFQGSGNRKLAAVFAKARSLRPKFYQRARPFTCIVFIDEIDGLQRNRAGLGNGEEDRFMNAFLAAITDPQNSDILFIGATNFIENIDPALKRDGRLVPIKFELPSDETRKDLVAVVLNKYKAVLNEEILSMKDLLQKTKSFSSATLDEIIKRAVRNNLINKAENPVSSFSLELKNLIEERKQQESQRDALPDGAQGLYS